MKTYKFSEWKKLTFLEKVKAYTEACGMDVEVESMDPTILSDIGTEGVVLGKHVVYLAKGNYEFDSITGKRTLPGYTVWKEVPIAATRWSPPDADVVDIVTTQNENTAIEEALKVVVTERCGYLNDVLGDSQAAEAEEEYDNLLQQNTNGS